MARPARPAALKIIEGRGHGRDSGGRLVKKPPSFVRLPPSPPEWLSGDALDEWKRVLPELMRLDLTKELDGSSLATYCETFAVFKAASLDVQQRGVTVEKVSKDGVSTVANPSVRVMLTASSLLRAWASEFGFSPAAEQKVSKAASGESGEDSDNPFG
jgi:P27 family predicted phage terminase small subunit